MSNFSTSQSTAKLPPRKKQKQLDASIHGFDIETLERELNAAKTKIVTLDTELKDKTLECSALWKRIKIFEERQNSEILDRYFPKQKDTNNSKVDDLRPTASCSGTQSSSPPCLSSPQPCPCSFRSHHCVMQQSPCQAFHQFCNHCSPCTQTLTRNNKIEATIEDVDNLKFEINHIKELLSKQSDKANDEQAPATRLVTAPVCTPVPSPSPTNPDLNLSLASVEELIVDPFENPVPSSSNHLNFQDQTVQLQ